MLLIVVDIPIRIPLPPHVKPVDLEIAPEGITQRRTGLKIVILSGGKKAATASFKIILNYPRGYTAGQAADPPEPMVPPQGETGAGKEGAKRGFRCHR